MSFKLDTAQLVRLRTPKPHSIGMPVISAIAVDVAGLQTVAVHMLRVGVPGGLRATLDGKCLLVVSF